MDVGVRELKAKLSEYLDRAEKGELIRVTDRGEPKALLGPLPGTYRLRQGIEEGWIRPGSGRPLRRPIKRFRPIRDVDEVIAEDRGD